MAVAARKSICGFRLMTFSGQVALHSPHCTQASSAKRSIGLSGSSDSAPVGQAETQDRHSVQPSTLTSTVPNGAPCGSGTMSTGAGAAACSSRSASRTTSRLRPTAEKVAGLAAPSIGAMARKASAERIRIVGLDGCDARAGKAEAGEDRLRQRDGLGEAGHIVARLGADEEAHRRRAVGKRRRDRFQSDLRDLVDLHRQHIGRQSVAVARQRVDQFAAVLGVVKHHHRLLAAGFAVGAEQRAQFAQQRVGRRQRIGRGAGRAGGGALAAAGADLRRRSPRDRRSAQSRRSDRDRGSGGSRRSWSANARTDPR